MSTGDESRPLGDDGWEPDEDDEDWDEDGDEDGDTFRSAAAEPVPELFEAGFLPRDPALDPPDLISGPAGGFAGGGVMDTAPPCSALAGFAEEVTGLSGRCAGASDDELVGVLRAWGRLESWAAERKLAVIAELIRRRPAPGNPPSGPGGMPGGWGKFCGDELAAAVAVSAQAAEKTLQLAHDLASRLAGTARALREGLIDLGKARIIAEVTRVPDPEEAAAAEALILAKVAGKTPGQVRVIAARAATSINPAAAQARRERGPARCPGGTMARGCGHRGVVRPGSAPRRGTGCRPAHHRLRPRAEGRRAGWHYGPAPRAGVPRSGPRDLFPPHVPAQARHPGRRPRRTHRPAGAPRAHLRVGGGAPGRPAGARRTHRPVGGGAPSRGQLSRELPGRRQLVCGRAAG